MPRTKGSRNRPKNTGVYLYVPATFDARRWPELRGHEDAAHWLLHKAITGTVWRRHDPWYDGMARISRQTMEEHIHPAAVECVRGTLLDEQVLVCDENFVVGECSQRYGLHPDYAGDLRRVEVGSAALAAKIRANRVKLALRNETPAQREKTHDHLLACLKRVNIDVDAAYKIIDEQPDSPPVIREVRVGRKGRRRIIKVAMPTSRAVNRMVVECIANGELDFKPCDYGRIHSPHTRLATECRAALNIGGRRLATLDISNSQLVFALMLMLQDRYEDAACMEKVAGVDVEGPAKGIEVHLSGQNDSQTQSSTYPQNPAHYPKNYKVFSSDHNHQDSQGEGAPPTTTYIPTHYPKDYKVFSPRPEQENINIQALRPDEIAFKADVLDGNIYNKLMADTGYTDRRTFKGAFFQAVLYGNNDRFYSYNSPITKAFQSRYPSVWQWIKDKKAYKGVGEPQDAFKELARDMQRAEANFLIGRVCGRLARSHAEVTIVTVHDSIMALPEHMSLIERIMVEEFERMGVRPDFKMTDG